MKYPKVLGISIVSTADIERYSLTAKSVLAGVAAMAVYFGIVVPVGDISPLIDQFGTFATQAVGLVSTGMAIYGGIRRIINNLKKK